MKIALSIKNLTGFIDDTVAQPAADKTSDVAKYLEKTSQVLLLLLNSVDQKLHTHLINCETPKQMWDKIHSLYGDASEDARQNAWEKFHGFRLSEGKSMALQIVCFEN